MNLAFSTGYGREFVLELLQTDCVTPISGFPFDQNDIWISRYSLEEKSYSFYFLFDPTLTENNPIFNPRTGNVEVCVVARLEDSDVEYKKVYALQFRPKGPFSFKNSWSTRNTVVANYLVRFNNVDTLNGELLQKDCSTPIDDTDVIPGFVTYPWDDTYIHAFFNYTFDPSTARDSVLFNEATSSIDVCHVVRLESSTIKDERVISIRVPQPGTVAGLFGDPHIMTFDGLQYDCQGAYVHSIRSYFVMHKVIYNPSSAICHLYSCRGVHYSHITR